MEIDRVQALAVGGLKELPCQFIRPPHERPENTVALQGVSVPIISLLQQETVLEKQLCDACAEWGFFLIIDHGLPKRLIQRLQEVGEEFFRLPQAEKESFANDPANGRFEGYGTKMTRNLDEKVEWIDYFFHLMSPSCKVYYDVWPTNPPSYREVTEEYGGEMSRITTHLLKLLSRGLGLEENMLRTKLGGDLMEFEMKINMYPPCPQPELALGVEPHTDMSGLTILAPNDVPGLQVWKDDKWIAVDIVPDALFVHVGDQLEVLTNGKFKSVLHRSVVNKERTRMSWAVFVAPPHQQMIGPLPELLANEAEAKYSTKTYAEYRHRKFNKLPQ